MSFHKSGEVAIVGVGCRLAPDLTNVEELWDFLCNEGMAVTDVPGDRWSIQRFYAEEIDAPSKTYMRRGSFLNRNVHEFEPLFFGISPREAQIMDPQQKLLLEVTWEAMENARIVPGQLAGKKTGVFVGIFAVDGHAHVASPYNLSTVRDHFAATATPSTMLSARLSHVYDFQGPCMSIDTACSSSLVALHQACRSLNEGETDVAVAGGVSLMISPQTTIIMSKGHFIARDGRSKSFDAAADGYGRGEGSVVFVLKRLEDAERDGDTIHAIVSATGINQDGRTQFLTSPDAGAQSRLMTEVLAKAEIEPHEIAYVEAHGTGTPAGDPIETYALSQSIAQYKEEKLVIGAIKANLGHTEAAAGALGTLKAALCLRHQTVPPQPNLHTINASIHLDEWNLEIPRTGCRPLDTIAPARYAGVNSFGYGGTNAIAIIRLPDPVIETGAAREAGTRINGKIPFLLTAFSKPSLPLMVAAYREQIGKTAPVLEDLAFSVATSRTMFRHRLLVLAEDVHDLGVKLDAFLQDQRPSDVFSTTVEAEAGRGIVFVYSGVGPQWWGMGRYLLQTAPEAVLSKARACDDLFRSLSGQSICEEILRDEAESRIDSTAILQPAIFLIQILVTEYLAHQGIIPDAVVGHSMGEVAAAAVSGALSLEDAVTVIYHRSRLQGTLDGTGRMLAVGLSSDAAAELIASDAPTLCIAAVNAPNSCTLAGPEADIRSIAALLGTKGVFARILNVDVPFHSPVMDRIEAELREVLSGIVPQMPAIPFYSTVTGGLLEETARLDPEYWFSNARQPVLLAAAVEQILSDRYTQFVEISPHPVIGRSLKSVADKQQIKLGVISTLNRQEDELRCLEHAVANIILQSGRLDWKAVTGGKLIDLPLYRWSREEFWVESERERRFRLGGEAHPLIGFGSMAPGKSWVVDLTALSVPWLKDHMIDSVVLMPAAGFIESALAVGKDIGGQDGIILENLEILAPLVVQDGENPVMQLVYDDERRTLQFFSAKEEYSEMWLDHGKVEILAAAPWAMQALDLEQANQWLEGGIAGAGLYDRIREFGFHYGPRFQTLRQLAVHGPVAYARVRLSDEELDVAREHYLLHPALLDGAMHALIGLVSEDHSTRMYVPVGFERLSCLATGLTEIIVRAEMGRMSENTIEASLRLYGIDGQQVAEIKGLRFAEIPRVRKETTQSVDARAYQTKWIESDAAILFAEPKTILFAGRKSAAQKKLAALLEENGAALLKLPRTGAITRETIGLEAGLALDAIVYMAEPGEDQAFEDLIHSISALVSFGKRLEIESQDVLPRIIFVSENANFFDPEDVLDQPSEVCPNGAAALAFFKGMMDESPEFRGKTVDVDTLATDDALTALAAEVLLDDPESEIALRQGRRFIPRVIPLQTWPERRLEQLPGSPGIKLQKSTTGTLDGLHYTAFDVRPPGRGEMTIRILATSLNFKDMLKGISVLPEKFLLDTFHGLELGMECTFEVVAVGAGVTRFEVGKRYSTCYPGCFASHITLPVKGFRARALELFNKDGKQHSVAEVTGLPIALATALYTLHDLARLKKGETLLVHSAAGGVGLAAIQIAKIIGARIFATAGNEEKRRYLLECGCEAVWDSRTLAFHDGILQATNGKGVDVVLNSLPGETMAHSVALLQNDGRFVEIGKKDIWERGNLSLSNFNGNVSFFSFDLDLMTAQNDRKVEAILDRIPRLAQRYDTIVLPYKVFPASEVREAFKFMSASKHIGKILVSYEDLSNVRAQRQPVRPVDPAAAYLITGGQGGLGLATADWLVASGARHVHLTGRAVRTDKETKARLKALRKQGARITLHYGDIADRSVVETILETVRQENRPLKGVFHAAGILNDKLISEYDEDSLRQVLTPKVLGGQNLDLLTREDPLDYFVLYSSVVAVAGNIGQSSYQAANSWLDALSSARRKAGRPALSVQWGPVGDVGFLAKDEGIGQFLEHVGFQLLDSKAAMSVLPELLNRDQDAIAYVAIDWETGFAQHGNLARNAKFSLIRRETSIRNSAAQRLVHLQTLSPEARYDYVLDNIKTILGGVLKMEPDSIDSNARPNELGVDSLAGVEIQTAIKSEFNVELSLLVLSRNEPIREIAKNVLRQISSDVLTHT